MEVKYLGVDWKNRIDTILNMDQESRENRTSGGSIVIREDKFSSVSKEVLFQFDDEEMPFPFGKKFYAFTQFCILEELVTGSTPILVFMRDLILDMDTTLSWMEQRHGYVSILNNDNGMFEWLRGNPRVKFKSTHLNDQTRDEIRRAILCESEYVKSLGYKDIVRQFHETFRLNMVRTIHPMHLLVMRQLHYSMPDTVSKEEGVVFDVDTGSITVVAKPKEMTLEWLYDTLSTKKVKCTCVQMVPCSSPAFQGMVIWCNEEGNLLRQEVNKPATDILKQEVFGSMLVGTIMLSRVDCDD